MNRRRLFRVFCALLLTWAGGGWAIELYRNAWLARADPWLAEEPSTWRFSSQRVTDLGELLAPLNAELGGGRLAIAVIAELTDPKERFFLFLWAAYLLPRHEVRPYDPDAGWEAYDRCVVYGGRLEDPRLETLHVSSLGALYRVR